MQTQRQPVTVKPIAAECFLPSERSTRVCVTRRNGHRTGASLASLASATVGRESEIEQNVWLLLGVGGAVALALAFLV
ncbi:MAG: hypothetical protein EPO07_20550 [Verrucomicrobia bacterium]|nr:MAG: hypothetical protein EPO07_20550 [Verrucomicrobiota bacterium]